MIHIADWNTGEDYRTFRTEEEAIKWINENCEQDENDAVYYMGNRVEMY